MLPVLLWPARSYSEQSTHALAIKVLIAGVFAVLCNHLLLSSALHTSYP